MVGVRVVVGIVLVAVASALSAQAPYSTSDGYIYGYPEIYQNKGPQNYFQHARATQLPDGSVVVTGNTGHCCFSATEAWEGAYALWYQGGGSWPWWIPIYGTNNFGREWMGQHELGFVDVAYMEDRWIVAGICTMASSWGLSNRAQVCVLEMRSITSGVVDVPWNPWFCSSAGCQPFPDRPSGACIGAGFGLSMLRHNGRWFVYYSDDCADVPGYYRREIVGPSDIVLGPPELVRWIEPAAQVGAFAVGRDGYVFALSDRPDRKGFVEWRSGDGVWFAKTGREWQGGGAGALWDASYMKTPYGAIVEPRVILASEDDLGDLWRFDPPNRWRVRWIADSPAGLPPGWWLDPQPNRTIIDRRTGQIRRRLENGG